ncbi:MAG TPA: glycosyltransferase family 9 protein [Edaphobacter sp.]|jgi:ADP-heptose:LPS heptosyltransferase|nr:glycosyltransferase family 9 protein [Edaphobacter sp.]
MLARTLLAVERIFRRKVAAVEPERVKQVLVLEYMLPLGNCVHLTPFFEALKVCRPDVSITVATRGMGAQVLRHSLFVDRLIDTPDPLTDLKAAVLSLRRDLRRVGLEPDCVLTGASDQRTRIALLGLFGAGAWRGGYTLKPALYQRPLEYDRSVSLIANHLRLAGVFGCQAERLEPRVFFSKENAETARVLLREVNPKGLPLVVMVTQNSGGQATGWHRERFARVIRHASETQGCAVVYVGTSADVAAIEAIRQAAGGVGASIAGRTSVTELAAVLAMSDAMVTLDTGTMHIGRAVKTPMAVLGPSWQRPIEWLPLEVQNVRILRGVDRDDVPENYRLDEISAESVIAALDDLMRAYPADAKARESRVEQSLSAVDHLALTS